MKKFLFATLAMCLSVGIAHANTADKQKIIDHLKYFSDDPAESVLSSDGKRRYQKEYSINKDGGVDVRIREKYLPAVTDGKNYTPKSSYFAFSPKVMKYAGKVARGANAVGIGLLMIDVLGEGVDWVLDPVNNSVIINTSPYRNSEVDGKLGDYYITDTDTAKSVTLRFLNKISPGYQSSVKWCRNMYQYIECHYDAGFSGYISYYPTGNDKRVMSEAEFEQIVKDLAKAGNINAKQVILDAGKDEIADGKHDDDITRLADDITSGNAQDDPQPDPDNPPKEGTDTPTDGDTTSDPKTPPDDTGTGQGDNEQADEVRQDRTPNNNFELPPFCSWATVVCDFIDWVRQEPPKDEPPKTVPKKGVGDIPELSDVDRYKERIDFQGQCPTGQISFGINGTQYSYVMSYAHLCQLLEQLEPWLLAFTYLSTAYFIVSNL